MDFTIPYEYDQLRLLARKFIDTELRPLEKEVEKIEGVIPRDMWKGLVKKAQDLGLYDAHVPTEYGGGGIRSLLAHVLVQEEVGKTLLCFRHLFYSGYEVDISRLTEDQIEKWCVPFWRGEARWAGGISEPDAGSDLWRMQTTAVKKGDTWVINGMKHFVSTAADADIIWVISMTHPEERGFTILVVEKDTPGFSIGNLQHMMGQHGEGQYEIHLDDVVVPADHMLGEEGKGATMFYGLINVSRVRAGAWGLGAADYALNASLNHAKQRVTFGQPLSNRQAIQGMLIDSWMEIETTRSLMYRTAWMVDQEMSSRELLLSVTACKILGTDLGCRVLDRAIQIHGGMGYTTDFSFERLYRDLRGFRIAEGANEMLKFHEMGRLFVKD